MDTSELVNLVGGYRHTIDIRSYNLRHHLIYLFGRYLKGGPGKQSKEFTEIEIQILGAGSWQDLLSAVKKYGMLLDAQETPDALDSLEAELKGDLDLIKQEGVNGAREPIAEASRDTASASELAKLSLEDLAAEYGGKIGPWKLTDILANALAAYLEDRHVPEETSRTVDSKIRSPKEEDYLEGLKYFESLVGELGIKDGLGKLKLKLKETLDRARKEWLEQFPEHTLADLIHKEFFKNPDQDIDDVKFNRWVWLKQTLYGGLVNFATNQAAEQNISVSEDELKQAAAAIEQAENLHELQEAADQFKGFLTEHKIGFTEEELRTDIFWKFSQFDQKTEKETTGPAKIIDIQTHQELGSGEIAKRKEELGMELHGKRKAA